MHQREWRRDTSAEAALVRLAQAGDRSAFDRLVAQYRGGLLAAAFARTGDREAAEDIVQQVLATAWRGLPALREAGAFAGWLRTIMLNACRYWHRRRLPEAAWRDDDADMPAVSSLRCDPIDDVLLRERQHAIREALRDLPADNRVAFVLHVVGRYRSEEIAELLQVPLTTVEGRIHRARLRLRRLLRDEEDYDG